MNKSFFYLPLFGLLLASCVSQQVFDDLQALQDKTKASLDDTTVKLNLCEEEKKQTQATLASLENQVNFLKKTSGDLISNIGNLTTLSTKGAENLERSLESLKEKDVRIKSLRDAVTKRDSVTLALVTSLKSVLGNISDEDIQINVEKGAVFVSISDKLLFRSGSTIVNKRARGVLEKVAKVLNDKPEIDIMVEGHTDNVPVKLNGIDDNWDLSVKRATAVIRILEKKFNVSPERMTAAGRSHYSPTSENTSSAGRAKNRRTRIVILPKLDQFFNLIDEGLKAAE